MTRKLIPLAACMMMPGPMRKPSPDAMVAVQFTTTPAAAPAVKPSKPTPQKVAPKPAAVSGKLSATNKQLARERTHLENENRRLRSELKAVQADKAKQYQFTLPAGLAKLAASIRLP